MTFVNMAIRPGGPSSVVSLLALVMPMSVWKKTEHEGGESMRNREGWGKEERE